MYNESNCDRQSQLSEILTEPSNQNGDDHLGTKNGQPVQ